MAVRQVITIDVSFEQDWNKLTTKEILDVLVKKSSIKNLTITNVNKQQEK